MSKYLKTIKEFLNEETEQIIDYLKDIYEGVSDGEVSAWKSLIDDLKASSIEGINEDLYISIEYALPIDGMIIDALIAGYDISGNKKVYIIEAKRWNDQFVATNNFGEYRSGDLVLHPQVQVSRHAVAFEHYQDTGSNYVVHPYLYVKNLSDIAIGNLVEMNPVKSTSVIDITRDLNEIIEVIGRDLISSDTSIFNDLSNAEYRPSIAIIDAMKSVGTKHEPFILTSEQEVVVKEVLRSFEEGKKIVRITGSAGSGKTAILLHLYIKLLNEANDAKRPILISGNQNTKLYRSLFPPVAGSFSYSYPLRSMVRRDVGHKYFICMDEAQHNKPGIITEMINRGAHLILCYDESQTINAENSLEELEQLDGRGDFVSIELQNSVRFSGSQVFEENVNKVLDGEEDLIDDDMFDFRIFDTIEGLENHTVDVIQRYPNSTVAVTGLLSKDAADIASRPDSQIFVKWEKAGETLWIPYIESKNYLAKYGGKLWVGTWWSPGLDFDYVSVIIGGDAIITSDGIMAIPSGGMHYEMIISAARKFGFPVHLFVGKNKETAENILKYVDDNPNSRETFVQELSQLIRNIYYILLTRGRKGCFVYFSRE